MKKINLPITHAFSTQSIDLQDVYKELNFGKKKMIPIGSIDFSEGKDIDQARINGGLIIWCSICLEQKLESIIVKFIFPSLKENSVHKGRSFFSNRIIRADHFSYSTKKGLVIDIVNDESLLIGKEKDHLSKILKQVMDFRNAFAHGDITYEVDKGCVLRYWKGGLKMDILTDEYWKNIEECFQSAHTLTDQIISKL